jgi:hypothetical protein
MISKPRSIYNPVTKTHTTVRRSVEPKTNSEISKALKIRKDKHLRSFMPNLIQSIDGSVMRAIILGVYKESKYIVNHLHDCILLHPSQVDSLMKVLTTIYTNGSMDNLSDDLLFNTLEQLLDDTKKEKLKGIQTEFNELKDDFKVTKDNFDPWMIYSFED